MQYWLYLGQSCLRLLPVSLLRRLRTSGEGSLEITMRFWTFNRLSLTVAAVASPEADSDSMSSSSSIKDVTAVMVLNWSMEMEEGHLEPKMEAAKSGMESEVGKKEEYWDSERLLVVSQSTRNRVICWVSW